MSYYLSQTIAIEPVELFCSEFSPLDSNLVAVGCSEATLKLVKLDSNKVVSSIFCSKSSIKYPITHLCFKPHSKNIVTIVNGNTVQHYHITSGQFINQIQEQEFIHTVSYNQTGEEFATGGVDTIIRVYDSQKQNLIRTCQGGNGITTSGHSNRIFAVKFFPNDPNLIISGGWDNTIQIYDMRQQQSIRSIFGPHICGDALDVNKTNNNILAGSWRPDHQLQVFDFSSGKCVEDIALPSDPNTGQKCNIYGCKYNQIGNTIAMGGSGSNEMRVLLTQQQHITKTIGAINGLPDPLSGIAFDTSDRLVVGTATHHLYIMKTN